MIDLFSKLCNGEPDKKQETETMEDRIVKKIVDALSKQESDDDSEKDQNDENDSDNDEKKE